MKLEEMSKEVKRLLARLMYLLNEIDDLEEEYPEANRPKEIQNTIDVLRKRIELIRQDLIDDKF